MVKPDWTTRLLAHQAREHGPAAGHPCLARIAQGTVCKILAEQEGKAIQGALLTCAAGSGIRCQDGRSPVCLSGGCHPEADAAKVAGFSCTLAALAGIGYRRPMIVAAQDHLDPATRTIVLEFHPDFAAGQRTRLWAQNRAKGLVWRLAWTPGWLDIWLHYRVSLLGSIWLTLFTAVMVVSLGFV